MIYMYRIGFNKYLTNQSEVFDVINKEVQIYCKSLIYHSLL